MCIQQEETDMTTRYTDEDVLDCETLLKETREELELLNKVEKSA